MIIIYIVVLILGIVILAATIPLVETIRWWRLWHKNTQTPSQNKEWSRALVFLTGISDFSDPNLSEEQQCFIAKLQPLLNVDHSLATPFPYSPRICKLYTQINIAKRLFGSSLPMWVCSLHNFWQTFLAVVFRKSYGKSVAYCLQNSLGNIKSGQTIFFVCGSAGAAIILAAIPHLVPQNTTAKIIVISYGGIFCFNEGSVQVTHHFQFVGKKDIWVRMWRLVMCSWPNRFYNAAIRGKKYSAYESGPHYHFDQQGYLSLYTEPNTEKSYQQLTIEQISKQILPSEEHR